MQTLKDNLILELTKAISAGLDNPALSWAEIEELAKKLADEVIKWHERRIS